MLLPRLGKVRGRTQRLLTTLVLKRKEWRSHIYKAFHMALYALHLFNLLYAQNISFSRRDIRSYNYDETSGCLKPNYVSSEEEYSNLKHNCIKILKRQAERPNVASNEGNCPPANEEESYVPSTSTNLQH